MQATPRKVINYQLPNGKEPVRDWLFGLKDVQAKKKIIKRLERTEFGNLGKHHKEGEGVFGMIFDFGPAYRIYFGIDGPVLVILLCAGEKHGQDTDIATAKKYWSDYKIGKKERKK